MFAVRGGHVGKVGIAVESEEGRHIGVARCVEQPGRPAECRSRVADCRDGMPRVVLAIPKGPFAVLPGLSPVDRRQADEETIGGRGCGQTIIRLATQQTTAFEAMVAADVMVNASSQTRQFRNDQITLRRMQVAAGRIAPQRPARPLVLLPSGKAE